MEKKGEQITNKSFEIIRERLGSWTAPEEVMEIVIRISHTTGDVEFGKSHHIPLESVRAGVEALKAGKPIITDVGMVYTGTRKVLAEKLGSPVVCYLDDPEVVKKSQETGMTRSELGMLKAEPILDGAVVAIGNAPTALFKVLEMIREGRVKPSLIVGVPVGFVGAYESKQALYDSGFPSITNLSERGGSPIAAAVVNGLLHLAVYG